MANTPFISVIEQTARNGIPHHFECEWPLSPGTWWEGHSYPREDRVDFYLRDITERKTAERKLNDAAEKMRQQMEDLQAAQSELAQARDILEKQNELLEERVRERTAQLGETISDLETFSYSITHDMRAPLRAMQGFSRLLLESHGAQLNPEGMEYLNRIANSANRLDLLIRDVLRYSNIVRARVKLEPVDLDRLLRDIIGDYPGFQEPNAEILIPEPLPKVLGNEAFLTQCFSNLLMNAVKFVAPGVTPRVEVTTTRNSNTVRVTVRDNGIGIPPEHQQRLFTLFHRAQNHYPGTGIGLAVVRKAVDRIGGQVGLDSKPGKGSAFWLELQAIP
jgi:signal transduction histidine kinase